MTVFVIDIWVWIRRVLISILISWTIITCALLFVFLANLLVFVLITLITEILWPERSITLSKEFLNQRKQEDTTPAADRYTKGKTASKAVETNKNGNPNPHNMIPSPRLLAKCKFFLNQSLMVLQLIYRHLIDILGKRLRSKDCKDKK